MYNYIQDIKEKLEEAGIKVCMAIPSKDTLDLTVSLYEVEGKHDKEGILKALDTYIDYMKHIGEKICFLCPFYYKRNDDNKQHFNKKGEVYLGDSLIKKNKKYRDDDGDKFYYVFNDTDTLVIGQQYDGVDTVNYYSDSSSYDADEITKDLVQDTINKVINNYCAFASIEKPVYEKLVSIFSLNTSEIYEDANKYQEILINNIIQEVEEENKESDAENTVSALWLMCIQNGKMVIWTIKDNNDYEDEDIEEDTEEVDSDDSSELTEEEYFCNKLKNERVESTDDLLRYLIKSKIKPNKKVAVKFISDYTQGDFSEEEITEAQQAWENHGNFNWVSKSKFRDRMLYWYFNKIIENIIYGMSEEKLRELKTEDKRRMWVEKTIEELDKKCKECSVETLFKRDKTRLRCVLKDAYNTINTKK